jgi:hypothetical protein
VLAVKAYPVFLEAARPDAETAAAVVGACRDFDQKGV